MCLYTPRPVLLTCSFSGSGNAYLSHVRYLQDMPARHVSGLLGTNYEGTGHTGNTVFFCTSWLSLLLSVHTCTVNGFEVKWPLLTLAHCSSMALALIQGQRQRGR